jgi:hypothetical protein
MWLGEGLDNCEVDVGGGGGSGVVLFNNKTLC